MIDTRVSYFALLTGLVASQSLLTVLLNPMPAYGQEETMTITTITTTTNTTSIPFDQIPAAIQAELDDDANVIPGTAVLLVYSDTMWGGRIIDTTRSSSTYFGTGDEKIEFACDRRSASFTTSFQKQAGEGYLSIAVIQNRELIGSSSTTDRLGTVIIGGSCIVAAPATDERGDQQIRESECLIATAAFGSELAPQVQFLRDFREDQILSTAAGQSFMTAFNTVYYSFSPQVADYEREQPWLQQIVRVSIYPLLGILTVSEKAYSVGEGGEFGAVAAGLAASSMIGAVYLAPLAFSIKQVRERRPSYRIIALVIAGVSVALAASVLAGDSMAMMITTSAFVVVVSAASAIVVARAIPRLFRRQ